MKKLSYLLTLIASLIFACPNVSFSEEGQQTLNLIQGPTSVSLEGIATLDLPSEYQFADKNTTVNIMKTFGNTSSDSEIGSVYSKDSQENWFIIFQYFNVGHISDKDTGNIDSYEILGNIKKSNDLTNRENIDSTSAPVSINGWLVEPHYNNEQNRLSWSVRREGQNVHSFNYENILLCREGYVSATFVCPSADFEKSKIHLDNVLEKFKFVEGKQYNEYSRFSDKSSNHNFTSLISGQPNLQGENNVLGTLVSLIKGGSFVLIAVVLFIIVRYFKRKKYL